MGYSQANTTRELESLMRLQDPEMELLSVLGFQLKEVSWTQISGLPFCSKARSTSE